MYKLVVTAIFSFVCFGNTLSAQNTVKWMSWEEAMNAHKSEPRKIVVDIYTDWCGWCKKMDKATFQQDHIAKYINENFYPVKFDAETKQKLKYLGKNYEFVSSGRRGYNELAVILTKGQLSYPTVTFLDENLNVIQPIGGFQGPSNFELIMTFFAEDHYTHTPWKTYTRSYKSQLGTNAIPVSN